MGINVLYLFMVILFLMEIFGGSGQKKQIKNMQDQIDELYRLLGYTETVSVNLSDEEKKEILDLKNADRQVLAIKKTRELTGLGLAEAKKYVDSL